MDSRCKSLLVSVSSILAGVAAPTSAAIIYVDGDSPGPENGTSWQTAYHSLRTALLASHAGDQIWVAQGVYLPGTLHTHSLTLRNDVAIYGGFDGTETLLEQRNPSLNITTLSGDLLANDDPAHSDTYQENSLHVVRAENVGASAILDGFIIRSGYGTAHEGLSTLEDRSGPGIFVKAASPTIVDCTFQLNSVSGNDLGLGGAVYCAQASAPAFLNCRFVSNACVSGEGGAVYCLASSPSFLDCIFDGNSTGANGRKDGGAVFCITGSVASFTRCTFQNNTAGGPQIGGRGGDGGAVCVDNASANFVNCNFNSNRTGRGGFGIGFTGGSRGGDGGAICLRTGSVTLAGCLLAENETGPGGGSERGVPGRAGEGAGLWNSATAQIVNSTVAANTSLGTGGGITNVSPGTVDIDNSVLWSNAGSGGTGRIAQLNGFGAGSALDYSCVTGYAPAWFGGTGNTASDPLFAAPGSGSFRLAPGSPCIDAASNDALPPTLTNDLDGLPRRVNDPATADTGAGTAPIVDMGAFEFQGGCPDFDADGQVSLSDLTTLLSHFGATGTTFNDGDIDSDGDVDLSDLAALLALFGTHCS